MYVVLRIKWSFILNRDDPWLAITHWMTLPFIIIIIIMIMYVGLAHPFHSPGLCLFAGLLFESSYHSQRKGIILLCRRLLQFNFKLTSQQCFAEQMHWWHLSNWEYKRHSIKSLSTWNANNRGNECDGMWLVKFRISYLPSKYDYYRNTLYDAEHNVCRFYWGFLRQHPKTLSPLPFILSLMCVFRFPQHLLAVTKSRVRPLKLIKLLLKPTTRVISFYVFLIG